MANYVRGSEWRKWDLHMHTPKSWLANQFGTTTVEVFVKKIVDSDIMAVGLTNYFKFADGEISGDDNIKTKLEAKGVIVFPNLELRLSHNNKKSELCDYHIIFDVVLNIEKINTFLSNLDVHKADGEVVKASNLTEDDLKSNSLYVDFEKLIETINSESLGIRESVLCGFLSRGKGESRPASIPDRICNDKETETQSMKNRYEEMLKYKDDEIERIKNMKIELSTKGVGESLEQFCQNEFNKIRAAAFPNSFFGKDNDASSGTKGDFVFRYPAEGVESISIMFEMKNENEEAA